MKVGFIGLGIMGKPMCKNLIKAGHDLIVTTHNPDTLKEMEALGAKAVHNGKEDRKSTRLNSSHLDKSRMPSSA